MNLSTATRRTRFPEPIGQQNRFEHTHFFSALMLTKFVAPPSSLPPRFWQMILGPSARHASAACLHPRAARGSNRSGKKWEELRLSGWEDSRGCADPSEEAAASDLHVSGCLLGVSVGGRACERSVSSSTFKVPSLLLRDDTPGRGGGGVTQSLLGGARNPAADGRLSCCSIKLCALLGVSEARCLCVITERVYLFF